MESVQFRWLCTTESGKIQMFLTELDPCIMPSKSKLMTTWHERSRTLFSMPSSWDETTTSTHEKTTVYYSTLHLLICHTHIHTHIHVALTFTSTLTSTIAASRPSCTEGNKWALCCQPVQFIRVIRLGCEGWEETSMSDDICVISVRVCGSVIAYITKLRYRILD